MVCNGIVRRTTAAEAAQEWLWLTAMMAIAATTASAAAVAAQHQHTVTIPSALVLNIKCYINYRTHIYVVTTKTLNRHIHTNLYAAVYGIQFTTNIVLEKDAAYVCATMRMREHSCFIL